jgi:uncharacterized protein (TIGR00255 family)
MTKSMTAFARAEQGAAIWEIRSVNHRYLDATFRMPDNFRHLEVELKNAFKDFISRGKLECTLRIKSETGTELSVNKALVSQLADAMQEVKAISGIESDGDLLGLMRWPDVLVPADNTAQVTADVQAAFDAAVSQLVDMRQREGEELARLIEDRLVEIENTVEQLRHDVPAIIQALQEKLRKRLDELGTDADPSRLEQELVIQAQKLDVMEELDRLCTHVAEVRRNLGESEPVGRRLDFLMQELNREANTLSSKSQSSDTTLHAVDLKVLIEQMREQIQNIE